MTLRDVDSGEVRPVSLNTMSFASGSVKSRTKALEFPIAFSVHFESEEVCCIEVMSECSAGN